MIRSLAYRIFQPRYCRDPHRGRPRLRRSEDDEDVGDDFESLYKGEISKSGTPILPSKRARKAPEKIQVSKEDIAELSQTAQPDIDTAVTEEAETDNVDVSLEEVSESENQETEVNTEDSDTSNS